MSQFSDVNHSPSPMIITELGEVLRNKILELAYTETITNYLSHRPRPLT